MTWARARASSRGSGARSFMRLATRPRVKPWMTSVPIVTTSAMKTSDSRCGVSGGSRNAAASVTTPRMPAQPATAPSRRLRGRESQRETLPSQVAAMMNIGRTSMTVTRTATAYRLVRSRPRSDVWTWSMIIDTCRPMSRNTMFSSRNWIEFQFIRDATRACAVL